MPRVARPSATVEPAYWNITQLSARLGIPVQTLRDWRKKGDGPPGVMLGGHLRYKIAEVMRWEAEQAE